MVCSYLHVNLLKSNTFQRRDGWRCSRPHALPSLGEAELVYLWNQRLWQLCAGDVTHCHYTLTQFGWNPKTSLWLWRLPPVVAHVSSWLVVKEPSAVQIQLIALWCTGRPRRLSQLRVCSSHPTVSAQPLAICHTNHLQHRNTDAATSRVSSGFTYIQPLIKSSSSLCLFSGAVHW